LSAKEKLDRSHAIGGSDANVILSGNQDRILDLWREKRGQQPPADLSDRLPVALGNWTEEFNRQWYEKITGVKVSQVGLSARCGSYDWRRCTLDGYLETQNAVWEAKHTGAFSKPEEILERYMPQLQHNMAVMKADRAVLSVIFGNHKYEVFDVESDWFYQLELLEAEENFWSCVLSGEPPVAASVPSAPLPAGVREICFEGNNLWAAAASDWLQSRPSAKLHTSATVLIKDLVEADVARAFGHGIEAKRSKSGAITIREKVA
jgi:predicted phage-related endonuclease